MNLKDALEQTILTSQDDYKTLTAALTNLIRDWEEKHPEMRIQEIGKTTVTMANGVELCVDTKVTFYPLRINFK